MPALTPDETKHVTALVVSLRPPSAKPWAPEDVTRAVTAAAELTGPTGRAVSAAAAAVAAIVAAASPATTDATPDVISEPGPHWFPGTGPATTCEHGLTFDGPAACGQCARAVTGVTPPPRPTPNREAKAAFDAARARIRERNLHRAGPSHAGGHTPTGLAELDRTRHRAEQQPSDLAHETTAPGTT